MNIDSIKSLWSDEEAATYSGDLGLRVYTSRLLGRDKSLVLHGGGNTSVKLTEKNILGEEEELLYVKGSGWDLETIEAAGFSPVHLPYLLRLSELSAMTDSEMSNELLTHMTKASAPSPSVETILHALLPYKYVDHTHANAFVSISNTPGGLQRLKEIYGNSLVYIPYVMPGFDLSKLCAEIFPKDHKPGTTIGMALEHHGLFSFGASARESYERMIALVGQAEDYLRKNNAWNPLAESRPTLDQPLRQTLSELRRDISQAAGFPVVLMSQTSEKSLGFAQRTNAGNISQRGPATPDHVIRTKRLPLFGRDVSAYAASYKEYFNQHAPNATQALTMLDPAPRVVLDPEFGMAAIGRTVKDAEIVSDIYEHTMDIIARSEALETWEALPPEDIFKVEYWELEQAKLRKGGKTAMFAGEVALVTGAASGIGKACVASLLKRGAAVVGLDVNPAINELHERPEFLGIECDLTNESALVDAVEKTARRFGGLDILILNAGIFPKSCAIDLLSSEAWRRVMSINLDANLALIREAHPLLQLAPGGGRIAIIGSKNVSAPGPGAAAYSVSKAAMTQLARVAALEWGKDNIRINSIHPNAVFDTGLWTDDVLKSRAQSYGLTVDEYKKNNILKTEITSHDVAELAVETCGPLFSKTTASQIPIDGGNERVI